MIESTESQQQSSSDDSDIINKTTNLKGLPDDYMESSHGWLPSYPGQEPPF